MLNNILETLRRLGATRLVVMATVAAILLSGLVFLGGRLTEPNMAVLYADLESDDSGRIVGQLDGMGVEYRIEGGGSRILVPDSEVLRLRMQLAEDGLPSSGSVGYEVFDRNDSLGTTSFVQNINHLRALEGELARTVKAIDKVAGARVHLVLPRRELFARAQRQPTASIVVKMVGSARLDRGQVQAIQHLAASAVPDLSPKNVSIIDDRGTLLSRRSDTSEGGSPDNLADMRADYENRLKSVIEQLVEQSVGIGNVRAQVNAVMNFDRITTNAEIYDPDGQVVRSTQTVEENSNSQDGKNQNAVSVANNLPEAESESTNTAESASQANRTEETVNYEISKTIKTHVQQSGQVKRLTIAVLVDGTYRVGESGKRQYVAREQPELDQIGALVRSAAGFSEQRGDSLEVINMRFARFEDEEFLLEEDSGYFALSRAQIIRVIEVVSFIVVGLLTLLLVIRPLLSGVLGRPSESEQEAMAIAEPEAPKLPPGMPQAILDNPGILKAIETGEVDPEHAKALMEAANDGNEFAKNLIDVARIEGDVQTSTLKKISELVERHPEEAVSIMRSWMHAEA